VFLRNWHRFGPKRAMHSGAMIVALVTAVTFGSVIEASAEGFRLLRVDGVFLKWGAPTFGMPARVTYAVLDHERADPNAINCRRMTGIASVLKRSSTTKADFHRELKAAFDLWSRVAGLTFSPAEDAASANILIGAQVISRGIAYANVKFDRSTGDRSMAPLTRATICLNPAIEWEAAVDRDPATYNLRRVLAHEIGHALGLNHPGRNGQVMGFAYTEDDSRLMPGDIEGIQILYGLPTSHLQSASTEK
jgi:hypothetical protein